MDLIVDLDFIPVNLDGEHILNITCAKMVARDLCEAKGTQYAMQKYIFGKELFTTGKATFVNKESDETKAMIAFFKQFCESYSGYSNELKGQILEKFNA